MCGMCVVCLADKHGGQVRARKCMWLLRLRCMFGRALILGAQLRRAVELKAASGHGGVATR